MKFWLGEKGHNDEEDVEDHEDSRDRESLQPQQSKKQKIILIVSAVFLFVIAAIARLYFLFFVADPQSFGLGWYGDVYHHWQIAYLSKEIGFTHGITRFWDLKGLEYFWGIGYSYILVLLFKVFGSADIVIARLLDVFLGSFSVVLVFLLTKRYFNLLAAFFASLIAALNPVGVFNDASGMQEPVGIFLLLVALWFFEGNVFLSGIFMALSSTIRAEYWLFSIGLCTAVLVREKNLEKKLLFLIGWIIPILGYMKILLDRTGNPIYPIYWNFIGNAAGKWQADIPLSELMVNIRFLFGGILTFSLLGIILTIIRKPKWYLFPLLGFGNLAFLSAFIGFTDYLKSFLPRFFVDRIFILPYMFLGFMISILLLWYLPSKTHKFFSIIGMLIIVSLIIVSQLAWLPIWQNFSPSFGAWKAESKIADEISGSYSGGSVLLPEDRPWITYMLYKRGIRGKDIRGQLYDPYYYMGEDPYSNWGENRLKVLRWLEDENIKLIAFYPQRERYEELIRREQWFFEQVSSESELISLYRVKEDEKN